MANGWGAAERVNGGAADNVGSAAASVATTAAMDVDGNQSDGDDGSDGRTRRMTKKRRRRERRRRRTRRRRIKSKIRPGLSGRRVGNGKQDCPGGAGDKHGSLSWWWQLNKPMSAGNV